MLQTKTAIGERDQKIRIDSPIIEDGEANSDEIVGWTPVCNPWAKVTHRQGQEVYEADRNTAKGTTVFNIRYRTGITEKMRVVYQGGWYDIFSVKPVGRKSELEIAADFKDNQVVT